MRVSTDLDTENSQDGALSGKGLDLRNRKGQGENVMKS